MDNILDFKSAKEFKDWLIVNHEKHDGIDIFLYKKGYRDKGLTYEDAVRTALCYGWIDAVTHSYNDEKFIQYFARRKKNSNWSLSNIKRMKDLIEGNQMTKAGLTYFDMNLLGQLDELIAREEKAKNSPVEIPGFFEDLLLENQSLDLFLAETKSTKRRYINYILDAKRDQTKINRCMKIIGILNGEKNNL